MVTLPGIYSGQHICEEQVESGGIAVGASSRCTDSKISARSDNFSNGSNCNVANNNLSSGTGHSSVLGTNAAGDPTPPMTHRRLAKSFSVSNSTSTKGGEISFLIRTISIHLLSCTTFSFWTIQYS